MASNRDWGVTPQELTVPPFAGPNDPQLLIGPQIPTIISQFYGPPSFPVNTVIACIIGQTNATHYAYRAYIQIGTTGETAVADGMVDGTNVREFFSQYLDPASGIPRTIVMGDFFGTRTDGISVSIAGVPGARLDPFGPNPSDFTIQSGVDFFIDNVSQGRGLVDFVSSVANTAAIGAEAVILTGGTITWQANRAYAVTYHQITQGSVINAATFMIRRTNLAGLALCTTRHPLTPAATTFTCEATVLVRNNTNADITQNVVLTMAATAGTVTGVGAVNAVRWMRTEDLGWATAYPNVAQI